MKNSLKFITESEENVKLLDELDAIVKSSESKSIEELNKLFNSTMYKIIKAGIKEIDFEKLSASAKNLLVGFISGLTPKEVVDPKKILDKILNSYAAKRRGEDVKQEFNELKASFKSCISEMIEAGKIDFDLEKLPPFSLELFDKYTECKYIVVQQDGNKQAFSTMKEMKDSGIEFKDYKFDIKMKEAEKQIGNFSYYSQWWKGKDRKIESLIISTDLGMDLICDKDLLAESFKESTFYTKPSKYEVYKISESVTFITPNSEFNATTMPSWIKNIDMGKVAILESSELEKTIEFLGDKLKGIYLAKRETEGSDFWVIQKESQHAHNQCMECSDVPKYEVKWAEGHGHAWFCESHFKSWSNEHKDDIDYVKEVKNGVAAKKFAENTNPNIRDTILK